MIKDKFNSEKDLEKIKNSINNIILFGNVGAGKTTIFNKICGQNCKTGSEGFSITKEVQYHSSIKYNNIVIDFPGLNPKSNIVNNIKVIKHALSILSIKMICFIVQYEKIDLIMHNISVMLNIFKEIKKNICLIITKSEEIGVKHKAFIENISYSFGINKIIYSTLKSNEFELLDKLEKYKNGMTSINHLNFKTSDFIRIIEPQFDSDCCDDRKKFINEFQNSLKIFWEEFSKANEKDLKRALYFALRDYKDNLIKRYYEIVKNKKKDNNLIITELIMLNNEIFYEYNNYKKQVELDLDPQTKNKHGENNNYKKCPHCGKIWFRFNGSSFIICGKRFNAKDHILWKYTEYDVKFINGIITIKKEEKNIPYNIDNVTKWWNGLREDEKCINQNRGERALIKPEGCGEKLNWNYMEDVTEEVLSQLKEINDNYDNVIMDISHELGIDL